MALLNGKRNSIKRGNFNNIDFNVVADGELVYAKDIEKLYIKNGSVANLINNVTIGDTNSRPPANNIDNKLFYFDTDTNVLWLSDGSTWHQINSSIQVSKLRNDVAHLIVRSSYISRSGTGNFITLNTSSKIYVNIAIPSNFSSLVSAKLVFISASTRDVYFHIRINAAKAGERYDQQNINDSVTVPVSSNHTIIELDLLSTMSQLTLEPNMYMGINCDPNRQIDAILFKWQYLAI